MPLQKVIFNRPTSDYGTTSRAFVKRSPLGKSQESENGLWQNRWGRAQTFLFGLGTALFALLFLVLRTQNDWLAESSGAQFFAFYSLIRKYGWVLPYSEALSIALGLAMFTGTAIGLVLGSTNPLAPQ